MHPAIEAHHRRRKTAKSGDVVRCARNLAPKLPASTTICEPDSSFSINGLPLTTLRNRKLEAIRSVFLTWPVRKISCSPHCYDGLAGSGLLRSGTLHPAEPRTFNHAMIAMLGQQTNQNRPGFPGEV
jgi:hypothetical protein